MLNSCGSAKSEILYKDIDFKGQDLLNSSITIYPPKDVLIANNKYSDYSPSEVKTEIATRLKKEIEKESIRANIFLENEPAPSSLKTISFKNDELKKFLKTVKTKYIISIQQVLVGEDTKKQSMSNSTGGSFTFDQEVVKVTIYFDIWKTDQNSSVMSAQVSSDVSGGGIVHTLYLTCDKVISEFVDLLKK
jgi:hypothetical protein